MEINAFKIFEIINKYKLRHGPARYLSHVSKSGDYREYENHKKNLQRICSSSFEYEKAIRCLTDIMGI